MKLTLTILSCLLTGAAVLPAQTTSCVYSAKYSTQAAATLADIDPSHPFGCELGSTWDDYMRQTRYGLLAFALVEHNTNGTHQAGFLTSGMISNGAVTTEKLADGSVTSNTLAAGAVQTTHLAAGAVTTEKIAAAAVSDSQLANNSLKTKTNDSCYATLTIDEHLSSVVGSNEVWTFEFHGYWSANHDGNAPKFRVKCSGTGSSVDGVYLFHGNPAGSGIRQLITSAASGATCRPVQEGMGDTSDGALHAWVTVNTGTGGNVYVEWAKDATSAYTTCLTKGSWMVGRRLQ